MAANKSATAKKQAVVSFCEAHDPAYGLLSPLAPTPLVVRHVTYPSLHHYFLCERFKGSPAEQQVMEATTVWSLDRVVKTAEAEAYQCSSWNKVRVDVMLLGTYMKFKQNEVARQVLLSTQSSLLLYHTSADDFWGDGGDGKGKNVLGVVTMAARSRLLTEQEKQQQQQQCGKAAAAAGGNSSTRGNNKSIAGSAARNSR